MRAPIPRGIWGECGQPLDRGFHGARGGPVKNRIARALGRPLASRVGDSKGTFERADLVQKKEAKTAPKTPISPLATIAPPELSPPPRPIGEAGRKLWDAIQGEYFITDAGGVELLLQSCALADRIAGLEVEIERTGLMIPTKEGSRSNPLLKEEVAVRSLLIRTLQKLGITEESVRPLGRPSHGTGRHHAY
jgi:hypothetical protein